MHPSWPLIGRREELEFLVERLRADTALAVVIGGAPGVGKTRLAREAAEQLRADGWSVEFVCATAASAPLPFGAFARLLPPAPALPGAATSAVELIQATVASLRGRAAAETLLVVIDDAQYLDKFSALLVHHLAAEGVVGLLLTVRSGAAVPEPLPALWKDGLAERVDLQPLSLDEVTGLLGIVLAGEVEPATARALCQATSGHPLLLHEVVLDALSNRALDAGDGVWRWRARQGHGTRLREAVAARLGALSSPERSVVEIVALSEPVGATVLLALSPGVDLEALERRAVLRIEPDGLRQEVRLWHPILADVIRGELSVLGRSAHAVRIAAALRTRGSRRRSDVLRIALLDLEAGDCSRPGDLARAALEAVALPDHVLAERLAQAAYTAAPSAASAVALGEARLMLGRPESAEPVLCHALALAEDDGTRARVAWDLNQLRRTLGRREEASAGLALAATLMKDAAWAQVMEGNRIQELLADGCTRQATEEGEALLARAVNGRVRLRLVTSLAPGRALAGRSADALELAASVVPDAFANQVEMPLAISWAFVARAVALLLAGELRDATAHVGMAKAASDGLLRQDNFAMLALFDGRLALAAGHATDAAASLREAVGRLGPFDDGNLLHWALATQAEAEALRGQLTTAEQLAVKAAASWTARGMYDTDAERALAWVAALGGERTSAIARMRTAAAAQGGENQLAMEIVTRHDAYRLGDRTQAGDVLRIASAIDGRWGKTLAAHVMAAEAGDPELLEQAATGFEAQGALILAAEASAEAAEAFRASGLKAREAASLRRSRALAERCGPVRTPVLVEAAAPAMLTRREREAVELAARGLSNAEIADRLFVSVRTAEGHLLRAFAKLGVSDRSALTEVVADAGE